MYDGKLKANKKVSLHILAVTQDQPERRTFNALLGGNSLIHSRFGWIADFSQVKEQMASCQECQTELEEAPKDTYIARQCDNCLNWCAYTKKVQFKPPGTELPPEVPDMLTMSRIEYDTFIYLVYTTKQRMQSWSAP
jgi:hypothetical protein